MKKKTNHTDKNTFVVKIEYSQNETWQGRLTWADENKRVRFRSALELFKLMDEAIHHKSSSRQIEADQEETAS